MNRTYWLYRAIFVVGLLEIFSCQAKAQGVSQQPVPDFIQRAQTVHIPVNAISRQTILPVKNLTESDIDLNIDGQPRPFQLARPWTNTMNPRTGQAEDRPNLLIILPFGGFVSRKTALEQAIDALGKETDLAWNISILDDSGNQSVYTRDLKTVIAQLKGIEGEKPVEISPEDWRLTATLAIASMRDLPGRRIVMSLGDIFHAILTDQNGDMYEAFSVQDVADAARNSGAVIYAAESSQEIELLRRLAPYDSITGSGPWLLRMQNGWVAGWITDNIADTLQQIRRDGMGAYDINLHLDLKQMDGQLYVISVRPRGVDIILNAPSYYIAPNLARLRLLATISPALREALTSVSMDNSSSPLELSTQLAYFPHPDGKTGTQIATTGYFWNAAVPPPTEVATVLQLEQTSSGFITDTTVARLQWNSTKPTWSEALNVSSGAYRLRVAAADVTGKIRASLDTPFTVAPTANEPVLISSVVLGKSCVFVPGPAAGGAEAVETDYLRAGNCNLHPDPTHYFSPEDIVWTLVRITPTGKLASRPSKDWKASFVIVDTNGSRLAEEPVHWLPAEEDGSYVATAAFPLNNPKLKLTNGEHAVVFRLRGPGIEEDYEQDAPFMVYGVSAENSHAKP